MRTGVRAPRATLWFALGMPSEPLAYQPRNRLGGMPTDRLTIALNALALA